MIMTVSGPIEDGMLGPTAMHEHVMVDFHDGDSPPRSYDAEEVVRVIEPYLLRLREAGCSAFVDCTPEYLGRDPLILLELSHRTGLHILTNTGWYNAPMIPPQAYELDEGAIASLWDTEARDGIGGTGIRPGFIKIALNSGDSQPTPMQLKILRAAVLASQRTGLTIVSHTIGAKAVLDAVAVMDDMAFDLERFIWAHADATDDSVSIHAELAGRGMWISLDGINDDYKRQTSMLQRLIRVGCAGRVLISQDSGWYNVGEPMGGTVRPYHTLFTEFVPYAAEHGVDRAFLDRILIENAARALRIRQAL